MEKTNLHSLQRALLQDDRNHVVRLVGVKFGREGLLGCRVIGSLSTLPVKECLLAAGVHVSLAALRNTSRLAKRSTPVPRPNASIATVSKIRSGSKMAEQLEPYRCIQTDRTPSLYIPVRHEHLEGRDEVSQRDALILQPRPVLVDIVHKDKEVVRLSLVVDLGLDSFSSSHFGCGLRL